MVKVIEVMKAARKRKGQKQPARRRNKIPRVGPGGPLTNKTGKRALMMTPSTLKQYWNCLLNPFEFSPIRLGWGCLCDSELATLSFKGSIVASSGGIAMVNFISDLTAWQTGSPPYLFSSASPALTSSTPIFGQITLAGQTAFLAVNAGCRIVSAGMRTWPLQALTTTPGTVIVTDYPTITSISNFVAQTPATVESLNQSKTAISWNGATWTYRPNDPMSFAFVNTNGFSGSQVAGSCGVIEYIGLPASTVVNFELILHLEYLLGDLSSFQPLKMNQSVVAAADSGVTIESAVKSFNTLPCNCPETLSGALTALPRVDNSGYVSNNKTNHIPGTPSGSVAANLKGLVTSAADAYSVGSVIGDVFEAFELFGF